MLSLWCLSCHISDGIAEHGKCRGAGDGKSLCIVWGAQLISPDISMERIHLQCWRGCRGQTMSRGTLAVDQ